MKAALFLEKIKAEFPEIEWKTYRYITHGWDHVVIILDEALVFRAPKDARYKDEFNNEIQLLSYLKKMVSVGIPEYTYIACDTSFAGYTMVKGEELTVSRFQQLSAEKKECAAHQLAAFITALHKTPQSVLKKCNVRIEDNKDHYKELVHCTRDLVFPRLTQKEVRIIEEYFEELQGTLHHNYQKVLVHNDLSSEHILWDAQENQINIIDFSDRSSGDPAVDFCGLREYGPKFVEDVFALYRGEKDEKMLYRSELYFKRVPLYLMSDALQGYPCTFEEGYKAFKERFTV